MIIIGDDPFKQKSMMSVIQVEYNANPEGVILATERGMVLGRKHFVGRTRARLGGLSGKVKVDEPNPERQLFGYVPDNAKEQVPRTQIQNVENFRCQDYPERWWMNLPNTHTVTIEGRRPFLFTASVRTHYRETSSSIDGMCLIDADELRLDNVITKYFLHKVYVSLFLEAVADGWVTCTPPADGATTGTFHGVFRFDNTNTDYGLMLQAVNPNEPKIRALLNRRA